MKPRHSLLAFLLLSGSLITYSHAATLYWDGTDTTANADGGNGTWDTTTANWDTAALGGTPTTWNNAAPDSAVFGAPAGAVTLGENITAAGILFGTSGYSVSTDVHTLTFSAGSGVSLSFGPSFNPTDNTITSASITGAVAGSGDLSFSILPFVTRNSTVSPVAGAGTLTLSGASTGGWLGATTVGNNFTLALTESNQALLNTSAISLSGGGIRLVNANDTEAALNRISDSAAITSNGGTIASNNTSGETVYAETLGPVALSSGQTNFVLGINQVDDGSQTLTLGGLTRTGTSNSSAVTFSSAGGLNTDKNIIAITGAAATEEGKILGPWATTGTAATAQAGFAVINESAQVVPATLANTTETDWTDVTLPYRMDTGALVTLTDDRQAAALQFLGGASTLALDTFNLQTYGLFFSGANAKTITSAGGALTTPTGGGLLYVTTGQTPTHTISATIADNGGAVTLVKSGQGTLYLNGTNSHSGGIIINAGNIQIGPNVTSTFTDAALGAPGVVGETLGAPVVVNGNCSINATFNGASGNNITFNRAFTINNEAILRLNNRGNITIHGAVTGTGGIINGNPNAQGNTWSLLSTANTFTGPVFLNLTNNQANNLVVNSFADGYGRIVMGTSGTASTAFRLGTGAIAPVVLNQRQIEFAMGGTGTASIDNQNTETSNTITINTDLINNATANRALTLTGVNTGNNTFAGKIANGASSVTALTKSGAGTWIVSGNNTYSGLTTAGGGVLALTGDNAAMSGGVTVNGNGRLNIGHANALGSGTLLLGAGASIDNVTGAPLTIATNNPQTWNNEFTFVGSNDLNLGTGAVALGGTRQITVTANTLTVGGSISGVSPRGIQKLGAGTLVLSGQSTYEGTTTVNGGTLTLAVSNALADLSSVVLGNGSLNLADGVTDTVGTLTVNNSTSTINLGSGATLAFADSSAVAWAGTGALNITGNFVPGSSIRFGTTSGGLTGAQLGVITVNGTGTYALNASGYLVEAVAGSPYETWAGVGVAFDGDKNGDGVSNGLAFLLGAADPDVNALGLLPTVTETGGGLVMSFSMLDAASRGSATLSIEHSSDLGLTDAWTTVAVPDASGGPTGGVTFSVTPGSPLGVTATISADEADAGKLFGRLKAENP
jgi:autotransporter-associated beta strand protein